MARRDRDLMGGAMDSILGPAAGGGIDVSSVVAGDRRRTGRGQPEQSEQPEQAETRTEARGDGGTDFRQNGKTEERKDGITAGRTEGRTEVRESAPPSPRKDGLTEAEFFDRVRARLEDKRKVEGGNKTTVDMSPDLARRAALYSLDHGKVSTRQVFVELLDAFLAVEGY